MKSIKVLNVFIPAGPQELFDKQEIFNHQVCQKAIQAGISLGVNIVAPQRLPEDFDAATLGCPYSMHAPNECLTQLYAAELSGNQKVKDDFWAMIKKWSQFDPKPDHVTFHLGGTGAVPNAEQMKTNERFNTLIEPEKILKHLKWLKETIRQIAELLPMVAVETVSAVQYVQFGGEWLPITFNEDRRGILKDLQYVVSGTTGQIVVDLEHLKFTCDFLNRIGLENEGIPITAPCQLTEVQKELAELTNIVYSEGQIPHVYSENVYPHDVICDFSPRVIHAGGLHTAVVWISDEETQNDYHKHLKDILPPEMFEMVKKRRVGSHAPIVDEQDLRVMLTRAIRVGAETIVLETANYGDGAPKDGSSPGCWYWIPPHAQRDSFLNLVEMVMRAKAFLEK